MTENKLWIVAAEINAPAILSQPRLERTETGSHDRRLPSITGLMAREADPAAGTGTKVEL